MTDAPDDLRPQYLLTLVAMLLDRAAGMMTGEDMSRDSSSPVVESALVLGIDLARAQAVALISTAQGTSPDPSGLTNLVHADVGGARQLLLRAEHLLAAGCLGPDGSLSITRLHVDVLDLLRECQRAGR